MALWTRKTRIENVEEHNLNEALVELTGPDGKVYQFQLRRNHSP